MKTIRRPISILLAVLMVVGMFTVLPITASAAPPESGSSGSMETGTTITPSAANWTFKLNSNFSGEWNADTDVVSEQPIELNLAEGDYEFQIIANDGTTDFYRGNVQAGSFTETYSQVMHDNGGNAKFHADGGKYTLTYNAGDGVLTIKPVYVAEIDGTYYKTLEAAIAAISTVTPEYHSKSGLTINKYEAKGYIKLLADCAGNGIVIDSGSGLTIDFDGHTYTVDGDLVGSNGTESLGFQLLKNSDVAFENGTITSEKAKILVQNYSNLGLYDMTLTLNNTSYNGAYTLSNNNGNAGIHNTTINANPTPGSFAFDVCRYSSYPSVHVEVTGEESVINGNVEISASNGQAKEGFYLNLDGGTMNGDIVVASSAQTAIENNPERAAVNKANTFTQTAPEGFEWKNNGDGTSTLVALPYAAKINDTKYRTLEEAFAAAVDGDTITLLGDSTGNGIKVPQGKFNNKGLIVDFDDNTYTIDGETVGSTGTETNGFQLLKDNKITFKNGIITSAKAKILVQNYSDLTLLGMILTLNNPNYTSAYTLSNNNGDVVIDSTTINANPKGGFAFDVCRFSSYPFVHVTVKGGSDIQGDVEISASKGDAKQGFSLTLEGGSMTGSIVVDASAQALVGEANKVTKADTFTKDAPEGFKWVSNEDGTASLAPIPYVAQIGTTKYETLADAIAAAQAGDTVKLIANATETLTISGKTLTLDLNGFNITSASKNMPITAIDGTKLTIVNTNEDKAENTATQNAIMGPSGTNNKGSLNAKGEDTTVDIYAGYYYGYNGNKTAVNAINGATVTFWGGTVNGATGIDDTTAGKEGKVFYSGVSNPTKPYATSPGKIIVHGGNFSGRMSDSNWGNYVIDGGTFDRNEVVLNENPVDENGNRVATAKSSMESIGTGTLAEAGWLADGYKVVANTDGTYGVAPKVYVAQISEAKKYETLEEAFAAAVDGDTITLLADCAGNGIKAPQGKFANSGLTVDFAGHTYTVDGETVGSSGTETNGFQLLKGNNITFKGGTITSTKAKILVQNYSNLTLDGMKLTLDNQNYTSAYTLSNNNGNTVIKDTTINANPAGGFAFDVCRFKKGNTYPSVKVTVTGESKINGNVEIFASNKDPKDGFSLNLESGTMSGKIIVDPTAAAAMESDPDKASVNKKNTFEQDPAAGYKWKDNGDGTSTLVKAPKLFTGHNITLRGDVSLNFFIDTAAIENYNPSVPAKVVFTYDGTRTAEVAFADATPASDGVIVATIQVPAAFMAHQIKAVVYYDGEAQAETDEYSIQQYAETLIEHPEYTPAGKNHEDLAKLMMEMLNYGAKAQTVFAGQVKEQATYDDLTEKYDYHMASVTDDMIQAAIDAAPQNAGKTATDLSTVKPEANATFYTASVVFLSESTLKIVFKVPGGSTITGYDGSQKNTYYWVQETDIAAARLDTLQEFTVGDATFYYSALDYAKVVLKNGNAAAQDLVSALYLYNQAANGYFGANA